MIQTELQSLIILVREMFDNKKYFFIDGLISKEKQDIIEETIDSTNFPWYKRPGTNSVSADLVELHQEDKRIKENVLLAHIFHSQEGNQLKINSDYHWIVNDILHCLAKKYNKNSFRILKTKAILLIQDLNLQDEMGTPHLDFPELKNNSYVALYYVNDSDGCTHILDNNYKIIDKINPKKGRILFMRGDVQHSVQWPKKSRYRMAVNINILDD
jgi:hypothetical protein